MYDEIINKLDDIINSTLDTINQKQIQLGEVCHLLENESASLDDSIIKFQIESNHVKEEQINYTGDMETNEINNDRSMTNRVHLIQQLIEKVNKMNNKFETIESVLSGTFSTLLSNKDDDKNWGIRIIEAQEAERQRIARDMHDGPAQYLSNLILKTELCIKLLDKDIDRTRLELQSLKSVIRQTIDETRRLIYNLRPMSLDDIGLVPTLERMIDKVSQDSEFNVAFDVSDFNYDINSILSLTLFRIIQEALNNVKKHANAKQVIIKLCSTAKRVKLYIQDDGVGFCLKDNTLNLEEYKGFGLSVMKERITLLMGELEITSKVGKGTNINISIPI